MHFYATTHCPKNEVSSELRHQNLKTPPGSGVRPSAQVDSELSHNQSQQIAHSLQLGQQPLAQWATRKLFNQRKPDAGIPEEPVPQAFRSSLLCVLPGWTPICHGRKQCTSRKPREIPKPLQAVTIRRQWLPSSTLGVCHPPAGIHSRRMSANRRTRKRDAVVTAMMQWPQQ